MTDAVRYKVNEQFDSLQGEGLLTGIPSTFIRLQGCPVGCSWCDSGPLADELEGKRRTNGMTANTWGAGGEWKTLDEIMSNVNRRHVIITGGEPTIWNLDPLLVACWDKGYVVQLETAGLNNMKGKYHPDWITWSPKKNLNFKAPDELKEEVSEIKFVVDNELEPEDVEEVLEWYYRNGVIKLKAVIMMPEGCPPSRDSIEKTISMITARDINYYGIPVRFGDRLQYRLNMR